MVPLCAICATRDSVRRETIDGKRPVVIAGRGSGGLALLLLSAYGNAWEACGKLALLNERGGVPFVDAVHDDASDRAGRPAEVVVLVLDTEAVSKLAESKAAKITSCESVIAFDGLLGERLREFAGRVLSEPSRVPAADAVAKATAAGATPAAASSAPTRDDMAKVLVGG